MRVEHHLLRLARIGSHEQHPAMTEPDMGDLHDHRHPAQQDDFVAPVELESLSWREAQRHVGRGCRLPALLGPSPSIPTHRIVAAVITATAQILEQANQCQLFAGGLGRIAGQQRIKFVGPLPELRARLDFTLVFEGRLTRPQHFGDRVPRHPQVPRDLLDRLALKKCSRRIRPIVSTVSIPPPPASNQSEQRIRPIRRGAILHADPPAQGVKLHAE